MGCMSCPGNETRVTPLKAAEDGSLRKNLDNGPLQDRKCTDVLCLLFFIAFLAGMGFVASVGFAEGDYYRVLYGVDSWGNTCNRPNYKKIENASFSGVNLRKASNILYFNPADVLLPNTDSSSLKICVEHCPNETLVTAADMRDWFTATGTRLCRYDINPATYSAGNNCPTLPYDATLSILHRCVPQTLFNIGGSILDEAMDSAADQLNLTSLVQSQCTTDDVFSAILGDVQKTWKEVLYTSAIAIGIAFLVVLLMGFIASVMIWLMVVLAAVGSVAATCYCWYSWHMNKGVMDSSSDSHYIEGQSKVVKQWLIIALVVTAVTVIVLLLLLIMRSRIKLVVQLFREAAKATRKMPLMLMQPLWTLIGLVGICLVLLVLFIWIYSVGDPVVHENGTVDFVPPDWILYMRWYYLFGFLWLVQLVFACEQLLIAGAVAKWYFTRDKSKLGWPIAASTARLFRYHLGTAAFGAFIIALVQLARIILAFIQRKLAGRESKAVAFILKCLSCCLWCFEKLLKFINRNAYIMVAIYGCNFCAGAKKALQQITANALRVAAINSVGAFCLLLCKLGVAVITALLGLEIFFKNNREVCFLLVPVILSGLVALFVGHCFLSIYGMTIDTIFMCFCEDSSRNDGVQKPYYMSVGLMKFVENSREALLAHKARTAKK